LNFILITCGGTIDKVYFVQLSDYTVGESHVPGLLRSMNLNLDFDHTPLLRKDSLEITDQDRKLIRSVVQEADCDCLITHGTDTMILTAKELFGLKHRIVLTGAMQPLAFKMTDAVFNVGFALSTMLCMTDGVYIAMNGEVFSSFDKMKKDRTNHRFLSGEQDEIIPVNPYENQSRSFNLRFR